MAGHAAEPERGVAQLRQHGHLLGAAVERDGTRAREFGAQVPVGRAEPT